MSTPDWRRSTAAEIERYYASEFASPDRLPAHLTPAGPVEYAVSLRSSHPLRSGRSTDWVRRTTREPPEYDPAAESGAPTFVDDDGAASMDAVSEFLVRPDLADPRHRTDPEHALVPADEADVDADAPTPAALYYRLLNHELGWVLLFDIDAKDVAHWRLASEYPGLDGREAVLDAAGIGSVPPEGFEYAFEDVELAIEYAFELGSYLETGLGAEQLLYVYSGQGAHVYVLDEHVLRYTRQTREVLKDHVRESAFLQVPIDRVVTQSPDRLARVPYSLHTEVSRVCQPIDSPEFDFREAARPQFLRESATPSD